MIIGIYMFSMPAFELYCIYYKCGTEYTPRFSRDYFNRLKKNTPVSEVLSNIGPPFSIQLGRYGEAWCYSRRAGGKGYNEYVTIIVNTNTRTVIRTFRGYMD
jgi:hypothetical protein